jgi:hypothetical protein
MISENGPTARRQSISALEGVLPTRLPVTWEILENEDRLRRRRAKIPERR